MSTDPSPPPPVLETLLSLSQSLTCPSSLSNHGSQTTRGGGDGEAFTWKQLIRIHESLLDSVLKGSTPTDADHYTAIVETAYKAIEQTPEVDQQDGSYTPQDVLMVIQYALRLVGTQSRDGSGGSIGSTSSLSNSGGKLDSIVQTVSSLSTFIHPLLLKIPSEHQDGQLRDAILDATFYPRSQTHNMDESTIEEDGLKDSLQSCTDSILSSTKEALSTTSKSSESLLDLKVKIEMSSKILVRLLSYLSEAGCSNAIKELVRQCIFDMTMDILRAICYTLISEEGASVPLAANGNVTFLFRPVTALLLPAVFSSMSDDDDDECSLEQKDRIHQIWDLIVDLISLDVREVKNRCQSWSSVAPSIATGVLCVIASSIQSIPVPVPGSSESEKRRLIHQPAIWSFLQKTLNSEMQFSSDWTGLKGGVGFTSGLRSDENDPSSVDVDTAVGGSDQMVRRRSIHFLGLLIDAEAKRSKSKDKDEVNAIMMWKKYALCFESLEMEVEVHLVDQIFPTVIELCAACAMQPSNSNDRKSSSDGHSLPKLSWDWVGSLFSRILLSDAPTLRKLGLYRLMIGKGGISVSDQPQKKKKRNQPLPAPLSIISTSFVVNVMIPSYDSLTPAFGKGVQFEVNNEKRSEDLGLLLEKFLVSYMRVIASDRDRVEEFFSGILTHSFMTFLHTRTLVLVFDTFHESLSGHKLQIPLSNTSLEMAVSSMQKVLSVGSLIYVHRRSLLKGFAALLSHVVQKDEKIDPIVVLRALALFPSPLNPSASADEGSPKDRSIYDALQTWIRGIGNDWASQAAAACASAFVSGQIIDYSAGDTDLIGGIFCIGEEEQRIASAIVKLSLLAEMPETRISAASLLWPAIGKAFAFHSNNFDAPLPPFESSKKMSRSVLLLDYGCSECVLSGLGHGDLVLEKNGNMIPPSQNIERLLSSVVYFLLQQVRVVSLCNVQAGVENKGATIGRARSNFSHSVSTHFYMLIAHFTMLKDAYPSSVAISAIANELARRFLDELVSLEFSSDANQANETMDMVKYMALLFASLSLGGDPIKGGDEDSLLIKHCRHILKMSFNLKTGQSSCISPSQLKAMRSIYQYSKWGVLNVLVPIGIKSSPIPTSFQDEIFDIATDSIQAAPPKALVALFETSISAAKHALSTMSGKTHNPESFVGNMGKIIRTLFAIMNDETHKPTQAYMLNVICGLIFRPSLLLEEYRVLLDSKKDQDEGYTMDAPIINAFQELITLAGRNKPHISRYVLSYITVSWLGDVQDGNVENAGLSAIPYRVYISELLVFKEMKFDEATAHQEDLVQPTERKEVETLPIGTSETSVVRGFLLCFISKLPNVEDGLSPVVLRELLHFVIFWLLDNVCSRETESGKLLMTGSTLYTRKSRAFQALCLLARFVTPDIAEDVCDKVFSYMGHVLHSQLRYFLEVFTIQCARNHEEIFISKFVTQVRRRDLTQQHISSLMIVGGNLISGRYTLPMFQNPTEREKIMIKEVLAGVIPWLSGTQGFCRAIAQLLTYELVPKVMSIDFSDEVEMLSVSERNDNDWFLRSIVAFLHTHPEMKRLRQKQTKIFKKYDADSVCTPEGCLLIPVDEGDDAFPVTIVDTMKTCLDEIYQEAHGEHTPTWKQCEDIIRTEVLQNTDMECITDMDSGLVSFQRKILPLDSLNLVLEENSRKHLKNAAGRNKQSLIVCATLIDKVPNLGGIARTSEIFAVEKLIIPDITASKMDNFKGLAMGAGDWLNIEECKEHDLLEWLKKQKENGYTITGVEQTSSSTCLSKTAFDKKTVLLLGKEKEGIPIEFLNILDNCVVIPQQGIIRSLNVHVSASLAIWEYTKQMMR